MESSFDEIGDYKHCIIAQHLASFQNQDGYLLEDIIDQCVFDAHATEPLQEIVFYDAHETAVVMSSEDAPLPPEPTPSGSKVISKNEPDHQLRPFFGWTDIDTIKNTLENTTQYARLPAGILLKKAYKSPNPALNLYCRQEDEACDTVYSDVPAIYDGYTAAVNFVGVNTQVTDVYGIKTDKQFVNTLQDNIIQRGAPLRLLSDTGQAIVSSALGILPKPRWLPT
jgi:hypothetical protein